MNRFRVLDVHHFFFVPTAFYFVSLCSNSCELEKSIQTTRFARNVVDAVGVFDFPRKSFVQIIGRIFLFSLSFFLSYYYYEKKELRNPSHLRATLYDFQKIYYPSQKKVGGNEFGQWLLPEFQILRGSTLTKS